MAYRTRRDCRSRRPVRALAAALVAAVALLAAGAGAPAADAAPCGVQAGKGARAAVARTTLSLLNEVRRSQGLHSLRLNARLSAAARQHSRDMVQRRYFSHTTPEGISFLQRIRASGYLHTHGHWRVGENLAWGWRRRACPGEIVAAWLRSPPHRRVMLNPGFRDVGIGLAWGVPRPLPRGGATYTADFGVRR